MLQIRWRGKAALRLGSEEWQHLLLCRSQLCVQKIPTASPLPDDYSLRLLPYRDSLPRLTSPPPCLFIHSYIRNMMSFWVAGLSPSVCGTPNPRFSVCMSIVSSLSIASARHSQCHAGDCRGRSSFKLSTRRVNVMKHL